MDRRRKTQLLVAQILAWADSHFARTGRWPTANGGAIPESPPDNWSRIDQALRRGLRGLPGGSSLAQLLHCHRGVRNRRGLPDLTGAQILVWADAHRARTGDWPMATSGPVAEVAAETWMGLNQALQYGARGLPGGDSLARLLRRERGLRDRRGRHHTAAAALRRQQALRLREQGLSLVDVGERLGVSWQAVQQMLRRAAADHGAGAGRSDGHGDRREEGGAVADECLTVPGLRSRQAQPLPGAS
jgi:hypothetical protein